MTPLRVAFIPLFAGSAGFWARLPSLPSRRSVHKQQGSRGSPYAPSFRSGSGDLGKGVICHNTFATQTKWTRLSPGLT
ncbi:hypothetical protein FPQ18DRAFT_359845 [Pyronema domesticum]|nr:hypothetical protein FPQ18DRAFT_359845 [Pyronema domesticum]